MSGEKNYVNEQMSKMIDTLNRMSESLLIDKINVNPQAEKYLSLQEEDIEKMTPAELCTGEYILSAYCFTVQRKLNRANAIKNWASRCLERIIAKTYKDYEQMMKFEVRKAAVALNDGYAKELYDIIATQESLVDDLTYASQSIINLSNSLGNLARVRSKNNAFTTREA
jgi:hypothetical protein